MKKKLNYVMAVHVPVFVEDGVVYAASEWRRALCLLRRSFGDRIASLTVVAPVGDGPVQASLHERIEDEDDIHVVPSMKFDGRARDYWFSERRRWRADVAKAFSNADIAHVGLGDLYRPINLDAFNLAVASGATIVFFRDTDEIAKFEQLAASEGRAPSLREELYFKAFDAALKHCVKHADVGFLKGHALYERYKKWAKNPHVYEDTSYFSADIVSRETVERRLAGGDRSKPLRLVYCGRFEARKGLVHAIDIIGKARAGGANVTFDIIGGGEQEAELKAQTAALGLEDAVTFCGWRSYGAELMAELATYDALFFTPLGEDTPRMIFDGYAAGLPLVAYDISYVRERQAEEGAVFPLPLHDVETSAARLVALEKDRAQLRALTEKACIAAERHAADVWYEKRATLTLEAYERRQISSA